MANEPTDGKDNRQSFEDSFFATPRAGLREKLREAEANRTAQMETLAEVSGITDVPLLEKLVVLGIGSETLAALTLYPLVAVAWADGKVDRHERGTVLKAAEECGLTRASVSHELLADWLEHEPDALLLTAWKGFVAELSGQLTVEWRTIFEREILARARAVANASGGFLALDKTSGVEERVLNELMEAFRGQTGQT